MTIHIGAEKGDIAPTVLMPGDPLRAKWAAENFLTDARLVNQVRGMLGYTGTYHGNPVTIHGSGMGMPSLSIYVNEFIRDYDAQTLIRIGSCGGMQPQVGIRDVILAMTATSINTPSAGIFKEINFAPCADYGLLSAAVEASKSKGAKTHERRRHPQGALQLPWPTPTSPPRKRQIDSTTPVRPECAPSTPQWARCCCPPNPPPHKRPAGHQRRALPIGASAHHPREGMAV